MNKKYILTLGAVLLAFPVVAQVKADTTDTVRPLKKVQFESVIGPKEAKTITAAQSNLQAQVEAAVARARAHKGEQFFKNSRNIEKLDPQILTQAESRLQKDRDAHSGRARHNLMYYYNQIKTEQKVVETTELQEYDPQILYRAEELLQKDRDAHSGNAAHTLDYYYRQVLDEQNK